MEEEVSRILAIVYCLQMNTEPTIWPAIKTSGQGVKMSTKPHGLRNIIAKEWPAICVFSPCFNAYGKTE